MNLVSVSRIWLFVLPVYFGFSKRWLFDLYRFDLDSGFSFEMDSQKNETNIKWILGIRISETALTNTFLFNFRFETPIKTIPKPNQEKLNLVLDSVNLASDSVTNRTYLMAVLSASTSSSNFYNNSIPLTAYSNFWSSFSSCNGEKTLVFYFVFVFLNIPK